MFSSKMLFSLGTTMTFYFCMNSLVGARTVQAFALRATTFGSRVGSVSRLSTRAAAPLAASATDSADTIKKGPVPMTLLAGFLGTGKTTTLKHLLENMEGVKIGVVVNDVASVNIDSKLVAGTAGDDMVELQNGCACCSLADELFFSVEKLVKDRDFDALVVELSGVADPMAIKNNWKMAPIEVRKMAEIQKVVTVVDSQTFGSDYMTWDMVTDRKGWADRSDPCAGNTKVSELLAEQVEAADLVMLNKVDLAGSDQVEVANKVAAALNDKADFVRVEFGKVSPKQILGSAIAGEAVEEAESHSHSHDHDCADPDCTDTSHSHSHDHACEDADCTDSSHSHSHDHSCADPDCTDSSHSHSHDHSCDDPTCTDTSHSHSHSHATSTDSLGISNFVYKADRPFATQRLLSLLNRWPVPKKEVLDLEFLEEKQAVDMFGKSTDGNPFVGVLRSKGFCWFSPNRWAGVMEDAWRHDTAMYLSHAGRHMSVNAAGKWWATIDKATLPKYFEEDNKSELERILREDFVSEEFGDRRQELVFIGVDIDESAIRDALDNCLLNDEEMATYREKLNNLQMSTMSTTATTSQGLFDVESTEHLDQQS